MEVSLKSKFGVTGVFDVNDLSFLFTAVLLKEHSSSHKQHSVSTEVCSCSCVCCFVCLYVSKITEATTMEEP